MVLDWQNSDVVKNYKTSEQVMIPYAKALVRQVGLYNQDVIKHQELVVLDNACGTGVVSAILQESLLASSRNKLQLTCGDISGPMIKAVQQRIIEEDWVDAEAKIVDAQSMSLSSCHFTHVLTNFAIMLLPRPFTALAEIHRVLRPNGLCSFTSWAMVGWYPAARAASLRLTSYPPLPTWPQFLNGVGEEGPSEWHDKDWIREIVNEKGLVVETCEEVKHITKQKNKEEYVKYADNMIRLLVKRSWGPDKEDEKMEALNEKILEVLGEWFGDGECVLEWVAVVTTARKPGN